MKIDENLRMAIRSAVKAVPDKWEIRKQKMLAAITEHAAKPHISKLLKKMAELRAQQNKIGKRIEQIEEKTGLHFSYGAVGKLTIDNESRFIASGGKLPVEAQHQSYDSVMAEVAAAPDQKALDTILKRLNIVWK